MTDDEVNASFTEPYSISAADFLTILTELKICAFERRPLPWNLVVDFEERLRRIFAEAYPTGGVR